MCKNNYCLISTLLAGFIGASMTLPSFASSCDDNFTLMANRENPKTSKETGSGLIAVVQISNKNGIKRPSCGSQAEVTFSDAQTTRVYACNYDQTSQSATADIEQWIEFNVTPGTSTTNAIIKCQNSGKGKDYTITCPFTSEPCDTVGDDITIIYKNNNPTPK